MTFARLDGERVWAGPAFSVHVERFRHDDGGVARREIVRRPEAVAVVAHDAERLYLVRRPREAVGEPALLELASAPLPPGAAALDVARAAVARELGKGARRWRHLRSLYTVAGYSDERVQLWEATGLLDRRTTGDARAEPCAVRWERLDDVLPQCRHGTTRIALLLAARAHAGGVDG